MWGSHPGPLACQANSLPIELQRPVGECGVRSRSLPLLLEKYLPGLTKIRYWRMWCQIEVFTALTREISAQSDQDQILENVVSDRVFTALTREISARSDQDQILENMVSNWGLHCSY